VQAADATPAAQPGVTEVSEGPGAEEAEVVATGEGERRASMVGNAATAVLVGNVAVFFYFEKQ
jgi:hypothetical protein